MYENAQQEEFALLVAVDTGDYDVEISLAELAQLADTAEIATVAWVTQKRADYDKSTCIGSGKLEEIKAYVDTGEVNLVIFDHELSATQIRNLEKACGVAVIDRTMLILDIFAQHARTREGRLQVELAQHRYLLPRLAGMGESLSRLGGGGGGGAGARRGKGETKLELNRRHIRRHIRNLEEQLEKLESRRELLRKRRKKDGVTTVAIVGYTNVGKSTLLNALTDAGVLAEDKLFATLDPTARSLTLPDGRTVMLIDTVGLVRRLPHHLVEAFKSTLEEALYADLILNVCDISNPEYTEQAEVTNRLLEDLGVGDTIVLTVLNKADQNPSPPLTVGKQTILISAREKTGLEQLLERIAMLLEPSQKRMRLLIPYEKGALIAKIREEGKVLEQEYREDGTELDALVDRKLFDAVHPYVL
ncbi:GTPase HflX [Ruminococcaceae bacterium OttesenSCG-928-L11]|nr:GTPase HflX [Ruminococcaceae bacterium OttesenSCG-928-L11]